MSRSLSEFLIQDHLRLEALLDRATAGPHEVDLAAYQSFRAGLLKHIGMEEKILLPALERGLGKPKEITSRVRRELGALAALLASVPAAAIVRAIKAVLVEHNRLEEGPGTLYDACEDLAEEHRAVLLARLRAAPEVPVGPLRDGAGVIDTARRALARAGFDLDKCGAPHSHTSRSP